MRFTTTVTAALCVICTSATLEEMVVGIELTANGATSAIYHPGGRTQRGATIECKDHCQQLLRSWREHCINFRTVPIRPTQSVDELHLTPQEPPEHRWRKYLDFTPVEHTAYEVSRRHHQPHVEELYQLDAYQNDTSTAVLTALFKDLKVATERQAGTPLDRVYAEIALPGWFYRPTQNAMIRVPVENSYLHIPGDFLSLTQRISAAIHRAGFRRSASANPAQIMRKHARGERDPLCAPHMALRRFKSEFKSNKASGAIDLRCHADENARIFVISAFMNQIDTNPVTGSRVSEIWTVPFAAGAHEYFLMDIADYIQTRWTWFHNGGKARWDPFHNGGWTWEELHSDQLNILFSSNSCGFRWPTDLKRALDRTGLKYHAVIPKHAKDGTYAGAEAAAKAAIQELYWEASEISSLYEKAEPRLQLSHHDEL